MNESLWSRAHLHKVATQYHLQAETMEAIAQRTGVSRSTVSRQLDRARQLGIVRISVVGVEDRTDAVAQRFDAAFGVRAHVVPVRESATDTHRLDQVARVAAGLLGEWVGDRTTIGLAWGTTVSTVVRHLTPKHTRGSTVVQLNGAVHANSAELAYTANLLGHACEAFDAQPVFFPVPAFFDDPATKEALWRERAVRGVIDLQHACDIVVFGVGVRNRAISSQVYAGDYLTEDDLAQMQADGAVGDICTVFIRADGTYADIALNARSSGPDPSKLARVPRRLCVAAGLGRVPAVVGALHTGAVSDLVIDEQSAEAVLEWTPRAGRRR